MESLAILCLALSAFLLLSEMMIPSMGLLGLGSLGALIASYILGFGVSASFGWGLVWGTLVLAPATIALGMKLFPRTPWGRRMIVAGPSFSAEEGRAIDRTLAEHVGQIGTVVATLRPAGEVLVGNRRVSCMSRGEWIEVGVEVRVLGVVENTLCVERLVDAEAPRP
jgi:membrane-bound ClpP family serine protease